MSLQERCTRGSGCTGCPGQPEWKVKRHEVTVINQIPSVQAFERASIGKLNSFASNSVETYLDDLIRAHTNKVPCSMDPVDLSEDNEKLVESEKEQNVTCDGNREFSQAKITKWPHLLAVEFGQAANNQTASHCLGKQHSLQDIPKCFARYGKQFNLRFVILGGGGHFITVLCFPTCWMQYNGTRDHVDGIKFKTFENDEKGTHLAMGGKKLAMAFYELTDLEKGNCDMAKPIVPKFLNGWFEPAKILCYLGVPVSIITRMKENHYPPAGHCSTMEESSVSKKESTDVTLLASSPCSNEKEQEDTPTKLAKLRSQIISGKKRYTAAAAANNSGSRKKIKKTTSSKSYTDLVPMGFSLRLEPQKRGSKPTCKGCNGEIDYSDVILKHKLPKGGAEKLVHEQVNCYHMHSWCIIHMSPRHLSLFLRAKHSDNKIKNMAKEIKEIQMLQAKAKKKQAREEASTHQD